jgi:tRNA pseudouridine38-40 synthase
LSRYKLDIQYDGADYLGWQLQKNGRTVQGVLESAVKKISNQKDRIKIYGAGRTDTGVHAWAQVAHMDFNSNLEVQDIQNALNANLPTDCRVIDIMQVENNFHSRFDAKKRYYRYQCYLGNSLLYRNQCWMLPKLEIKCLNQLSGYLIGTHDFLSFCKYREELKNTVCEIFESQWSFENNICTFKISANRFLHHMIRYLVGTMVAVCDQRFSEFDFQTLLDNPRKNVQIFKAPPQGLILEKILYA